MDTINYSLVRFRYNYRLYYEIIEILYIWKGRVLLYILKILSFKIRIIISYYIGKVLTFILISQKLINICDSFRLSHTILNFKTNVY